MKVRMLLLSLLSLPAFAAPIELKDFKWTLPDIAEEGLTSDQLYTSMNRRIVRVKDSICSNRAQVWAYDFKRMFHINTAKVFLFYTRMNGGNWWYHAANVVNENNQLMVLDAGYPWMFSEPKTLGGWFQEFTEQNNCREIRLSEKDLIKQMYQAEKFPVRTAHGENNCYYVIAPEGYWTPNQLAHSSIMISISLL